MSQLTRTTLLHSNPSSSVSIYQGSFGTLSVAIKDQTHPSLQAANSAISEAMVQLRLDHTNICKAYDCFLASSPSGMVMSVLVMELCSCDLAAAMQQKKASNEYWSEAELLNWLYALLDALRYAQEMGISHRNIQPHHILFACTGQPKLCDFSASAKNLSMTWMSTTVAGAPAYLSPEIYAGMGNPNLTYDPFKADVWALGATFLTIARGNMPVQRIEDDVETLGYAQLKTVLRIMLTRDPLQRPSFRDVMGRCQSAATSLYQVASMPAMQADQKLCFMCQCPISSHAWLSSLPADLTHLKQTCKDLCSLKCARHVHIKTQTSDKHLKCSGCSEVLEVAAIAGPTVTSMHCGHPFHDKACLERCLWQRMECPECKVECGVMEKTAILGPTACAALEASRCSLCGLGKAVKSYGVCNHQLCDECDYGILPILWGSGCRKCNTTSTS